MLTLFIQDINESYVTIILNEYILKILFLYRHHSYACDILAVLQTSNIHTENFEKRNVILWPHLFLPLEPSAPWFGTETWVPMLPCFLQHFPGSERTWVVVSLFCFKLQCKQLLEHLFDLTWQSDMPVFWYNIKFLQL